MKNDKHQNDDVLHNALYIKCNDYLWLMIDAVKRGEEGFIPLPLFPLYPPKITHQVSD